LRSETRARIAGCAATTPYGSHIGTLAGRQGGRPRADRLEQLAYPDLDPETPILDAVLQRTKTDGVDLGMVTGEVVYESGRFTRVDRAAALRDLHQSLQRGLAEDEVERPAVKGASAACPALLRRLFRSRSPRPLLPSELTDMSGSLPHQSIYGVRSIPCLSG